MFLLVSSVCFFFYYKWSTKFVVYCTTNRTGFPQHTRPEIKLDANEFIKNYNEFVKYVWINVDTR